jgi:cytochrome c biogenesis protein CcdA/thiol-disulfide isomerase/thioredoxin
MEKKKNKKSEKKPDTKPGIIPDNTPGNAPDTRADKNLRTAAILLAIAVLGCMVFFITPVFNAFPPSPAQGTGSDILTVYYFYGTECPHCHNVTPYVTSLSQKYPDVDFQIREVWHNETNNALLSLLNHKLGREDSGVPEAIIGNTALLGEDQIKTGIEPAILSQRGNLTGSSRLGASLVTTSPAGTNATLTATYFYGNGCSHCEEVKPLIADMQARYPELFIEMLEINDNKTNREKLLAMYNQYGVTGGSIPTIFIGENVLIGENEVKEHVEEKILAEKQKLRNAISSPLSRSPAGLPAGSNVSVNAVYFYGESCSHCEKIKPVIVNISSRYPDLNLTWLEIDHSADNRQQLIDMSSRYGIPNPGTPTIFIGNTVLIGEGQVTERFEDEINAERQRIASGKPENPPDLNPANPQNQPGTSALSAYMVVFAALVDSSNPCGLSVLVFLLISMAAAGEQKRILLVGGVYIAAMFLFHLFVGIGLFSAFSLSGLAKPFSIIGGLIALVLGIVTLVDVLRNKESYLLSIPESGKGMLGTYIRKATLPAAFILGILAGIMGFSCTGGIYISILGLMGRDMTVMTGLPWLILYNIIFVLPLVLVTLLVAYGVSPERADRWRTENKRTVRVIIGVILVVLGLVILSGWLG